METRTRTQYYRRRSTRVKCIVAVVILIVLVVIVVTVVAVTVTNANRRAESTATQAPQPGVTTRKALSTEPTPTTFVAPSKTENVTLSFPVFTRDRLEVVLNVSFQYHISPENFQQLYAIYGSGYGWALESSAVDELKGVGPEFSVREYAADDQDIKRALYDGLRRRLEGTCCKPSCETLPEGCLEDCVLPTQCTDQQRGLYVDAVILWSYAAEIPGFVLDRLREITAYEVSSRPLYTNNAFQ
ncbi:uncharacterized protein LOC119746298 [Patiria miniata]|uniref:Band 7 domain-containing protein n=1 Tax=Patiria miniata TaxID=46514 RepID=A0A914BSZ9_PATMI|nr:uncharacterized protein LOC119746298 [Patiria miniata]